MRKILAILTSIFFAIEIAVISFSLPQITQILSSSIFISLLFYLILKTEGLITLVQSKKLLSSNKTTPKPTKIEDKNKSQIEEEESEFTTQWRKLEEAAGK
jgi:hypothetical protein